MTHRQNPYKLHYEKLQEAMKAMDEVPEGIMPLWIEEELTKAYQHLDEAITALRMLLEYANILEGK